MSDPSDEIIVEMERHGNVFVPVGQSVIQHTSVPQSDPGIVLQGQLFQQEGHPGIDPFQGAMNQFIDGIEIAYELADDFVKQLKRL